MSGRWKVIANNTRHWADNEHEAYAIARRLVAEHGRASVWRRGESRQVDAYSRLVYEWQLYERLGSFPAKADRSGGEP